MMRAQIWSLDVIFALVIFSFTITLLTLAWFNISNQLGVSYSNSGGLLSLQAESFSDSLLSSGSPLNWYSLVNTSNVLTWTQVSPGIGLSANYGDISQQKLFALESMSNYNYPAVKTDFGLGYDFYVQISEESKLALSAAPGEPPAPSVNITIGKNPNTNRATSVYVERRSAFINGVPVSVNISVWTNSTTGVG